MARGGKDGCGDLGLWQTPLGESHAASRILEPNHATCSGDLCFFWEIALGMLLDPGRDRTLGHDHGIWKCLLWAGFCQTCQVISQTGWAGVHLLQKYYIWGWAWVGSEGMTSLQAQVVQTSLLPTTVRPMPFSNLCLWPHRGIPYDHLEEELGLPMD